MMNELDFKPIGQAIKIARESSRMTQAGFTQIEVYLFALFVLLLI